MMIPPSGINHEVAAGDKAAEAPLFPPAWERRQRANTAFMTLEQHLRDAGGAAEVPVNLKRRMSVPQVGQRTAFQQQAEEMICVIPIP